MRGRPLLLAALLCACAYTPPREPFRAGEAFTLTGTTRGGVALERTYRLAGSGRLAADGHWEYVADGRVSGVSGVLAGPGETLVALVDGSEALGTRPDATVTACVVAPAGPGWRSAEGLLAQGPPAALMTLAQGLKWSARLDTLRGVLGDTGTCTLTRS
ncbi:hypothetical protein HNQ07_004339 [Deinococcus metalli]|uniref:Lipoprotein n=1 Tax=Deinococcus metalli TaxID=1141878 RepID=A0A7W8NU13_9DEIO|nr:hypothetical protein [Deinococcus metalli]MBB5378832.1 hypothetical protein [Deinococcus metalli]GHF62027.1 hypothetical protein GCM10017781_42630 [Deinococcus metalli]